MLDMGLARWGRSCNASPNDWLAGTRRATRQCVPFVMDLVWVGGCDETDQSKIPQQRAATCNSKTGCERAHEYSYCTLSTAEA